jgi:tetratricopeptide (TPR) repeat protein
MRQLGRTIVVVDPVKGLEVLTDCLARSTTRFGPDDDQTVRCQKFLAQAYDIAEKPAEAVPLWKVLFTRMKAKQGSEHNETLAFSDKLAAAYEKAGRIEEALGQRAESLKARRRVNANSPEMLVGHLQEMARLYEAQHDYQHAEPLLREVIGYVEDENGLLREAIGYHETEDGLSRKKSSLGQCLLHTGKPAEAEAVLRQCLTLREKKWPDDWTTFHTKSLLGRSLLEQKKYADAEPLLLAGYEGMKKANYLDEAGKQDRLIEELQRLVKFYEAANKKDKADTWRRELQEAKNAAKKPAKP